MTAINEKEANEFRPALEENVRRVVAISALRRIHKLIAEREWEMRLLWTRVLPIATVVLILVAILIWIFGNPYRWWSG